MKKIVIGVAIVVVAGGIYWWSLRNPAVQDNSGTSAPLETLNPDANGGNPVSTGNPSPTPAPTPAAGYKDGTYTGPVSDAVYGPIQVVVTISGGKIVKVDVPVFPSGPEHTNQVSASSIPVLKQEVIVAQSAKVDSISGATQTVDGFKVSLSAALAKAS